MYFAETILILMLNKHAGDSLRWLCTLKSLSMINQKMFYMIINHSKQKHFSFFDWGFSSNWWRASNFDLYCAFMAIEQWGFVRMPHLQRGASVYNGHIRGPTKHACCVAFGRWLLLPCFTTSVCRKHGLNHYLPHARRRFYQMSYLGG